LGQKSSNIHFKKLQVSDGLSENSIYCILQDQSGFMWFGTKDGLNRYDGNSFKIFQKEDHDKNSLGNNFVRSIAEKDQNTLYIGTDHGLFIMDKDKEVFQNVALKTSNNTRITSAVNSLVITKDGKLWIGTMNQGIFRYNPKQQKLEHLEIEGVDLGQNATWSILEDKSGTVWAGTRLGLIKFNSSIQKFRAIPNVFNPSDNPEFEILSMKEDKKGDLWLGTWRKGLLWFNKQNGIIGSFMNKSANPFVSHIRSIFDYSENEFLIGSDDGLYLFDLFGKQVKRVDIPHFKHSLSDQNVYSIARDRENSIWIGTYFGGINYLNTSLLPIETFYSDVLKGFLSGKAVSQFVEDPKGNMWIATEDGGLNYLDKINGTISQPIQTSYHNTHALLLEKDKLWVGTFSRGLDVYDLKTKTLKNYRHQASNEQTINDDCIFSLYKTKSGDIYIGTPVGINKFNKETETFERIESIHKFIYDIKEDSEGNIWLATYESGPIKWDIKKRTWIHYDQIKPNDPIASSKLTSIYQDSQNRMIFTSEGKGIFIYDRTNDSFKNISQANGLPNNVIYGVLDDPDGNLWLSSNKGIIHFHPDNPKKHELYTIDNGFQSNQFNYKSSYKSRDGKFYFGGINGFTSFYPQTFSEIKNKVKPNIEITDLELLNNENSQLAKDIQERLNTDQPIILKHGQSSFTISFVSLSYLSPSQNQYSYMLEGADDNWTNAANRQSVSYVNLPAGKYTFKVKASNNDNLWNEEGTSIQIEILPPFWLSIPAKIFYTLLVLTCIYLIIRYYEKSNKEKHQRQLANFKIEQEQKSYASKIEFFTNVAHEIRTPVSLISAPLEEILEKKNISTEVKNNLHIIERNCERLHILINQLLDFRKMDEGRLQIHPENIDLKAFLTEIYERFRKSAHSKKLKLELVLPSKAEVIVESDLEAITKIISNLLSNAIKFADRLIVLELGINEDQTYYISVSDDGKGIPNEYKNLIFDPFYQISSNKSHSGTGIGLSLVKHFSNQLGGKIDIKDILSKGTSFIFSFTNYPKLPEITLNTSDLYDLENEHFETSGLQKILLIDDNPDITSFIGQSLQEDYKIDIVENGRLALEKLEVESYNLIISDIMMPEIDGISLSEIIKNNVNYSHIPIILLSAKIENSTKIKGLMTGADVFVEKPFSITYLKAQISSLLRNRNSLLEIFNKNPLASYSTLATNKSDDSFLKNLNEEIEKNLSDDQFNVESLVHILGFSRSNFQRKLKAVSGYSPGDYVRTYRLKKACNLLLEGNYRINEVCYMVGFSSPSYFTKAFIKAYDMTPKEFVNNFKAQDV
jgi:signal transduction histidine kinase/ligand-binding sensor domain-containing protein/DNA-binding response OmpR family regulator